MKTLFPAIALAAALLVGSLSSAFAAPPLSAIGKANDAASTESAENTLAAKAAYHEADYFLRHGRNFEYAMRQARKAVALSPQNAHCHGALGCALASRAASIGFAASHLDRFHQDEAMFAWAHGLWLKSQRKNATVHDDHGDTTESELAYLQSDTFSNSPGIPKLSPDQQKESAASIASDNNRWQALRENELGPGSPEPQPPSLRTQDDEKSFLLTHEQALTQFKSLAKEAVAEFAVSIQCASNDRERAEAEVTEAWGELLLLHHANLLNADMGISPDAILAPLKEVTRLEPSKAIYWQSLGDVYARLHDEKSPPKDALPNANAAYQRCLELLKARDKRDANVEFQMFRVERRRASSGSADTTLEKSWLRDVIKDEPDNSLPLYYLAFICVDPKSASANVPEALELVERANNFDFKLRPYAEAVPSELSEVNAYRTTDRDIVYECTYYFNKLSRALISQYAIAKNTPEADSALRYLHACVGIGINMSAHSYDHSSPDDSRHAVVKMMAERMLVIDYNEFFDYYTRIGNAADATMASKLSNSAYEAYHQQDDMRQVNKSFGYGDY